MFEVLMPALMYTQGQFKDVLFYKEDVLKNVERKYMPGEWLELTYALQ